MEQTLKDKRSALEKELPLEKNNFLQLLGELASDLQRRIDEQKWAMTETHRKRKEAETEAARLERVSKKVQAAKAKKMEVASFESDLQSMQGKYEELCGLLRDVQVKLDESSDRSSAHGQSASIQRRGQAWVQGVFWNSTEHAPHYVPPALRDSVSVADSRARLLEDHVGKGDGANAGGSGIFKKVWEAITPARLRKRKKSAPDAGHYHTSASQEQGGAPKRWRGSSSGACASSSGAAAPLAPPPPVVPASLGRRQPVLSWVPQGWQRPALEC
mmetsp:Transcript_166394/g.534491  ORF Transcript_166394/g.534491 Transcript_166394/m.534491 type:complete len:273 (+) Transcript_166394:1244-2062(+)